jgi:hypothetical protein
MEPVASNRACCVLAALALLAVLGWRPGTAAGEEILRAEAGLSYDSNLPRAQSRSDIAADAALDLNLSGGRSISLDERSSITLTADLRAAEFRRFHGMNNVALDGTASLRRKFGLGAFAPWASVSASLGREKYGENIRDGRRSIVALQIGRRMTESLDFSGGGNLERYDADRVVQVVPGLSGDVFSIKGRNLFARADYALNERWLGYAGINLRRGDVVASTRRDPEIFEYSSAVTPDPAFGADYVAYRLSGDTWSALAGASWAVNPHASLNIGVTRAITYATGGIDYSNTRFNATFICAY